MNLSEKCEHLKAKFDAELGLFYFHLVSVYWHRLLSLLILIQNY